MTQEQIDALPADSRTTIMQIVSWLPAKGIGEGFADRGNGISQRAQAAASMGGRR